MEISQRIRTARRAAGLTQKELAAKIGAATVTIQQYEQGIRTPSMEQRVKMALAMNLNPFELLDENTFEPDTPPAEDPAPLPAEEAAGLGTDYVYRNSNGNPERIEGGTEEAALLALLHAMRPEVRASYLNVGKALLDAPGWREKAKK